MSPTATGHNADPAERLCNTIEAIRTNIRYAENAVAGVAVVSLLCTLVCLTHAVQEGLVVDAAYLASVSTSVLAASVAGVAAFAPWRLLRNAMPDKPEINACIKIGAGMMTMLPLPTAKQD